MYENRPAHRQCALCSEKYVMCGSWKLKICACADNLPKNKMKAFCSLKVCMKSVSCLFFRCSEKYHTVYLTLKLCSLKCFGVFFMIGDLFSPPAAFDVWTTFLSWFFLYYSDCFCVFWCSLFRRTLHVNGLQLHFGNIAHIISCKHTHAFRCAGVGLYTNLGVSGLLLATCCWFIFPVNVFHS